MGACKNDSTEAVHSGTPGEKRARHCSDAQQDSVLTKEPWHAIDGSAETPQHGRHTRQHCLQKREQCQHKKKGGHVHTC
eukprot:370699-Rhodomonas_salina.3